MAVPIQAAGQWPGLTREQLIEPLRAAVRHQFQDERFWFGVRDLMAEHAVLAAHIRGLLSQIEATMRGTADERFWCARVEKVRAHLAPSRAADDAQDAINRHRASGTVNVPAIDVPAVGVPSIERVRASVQRDESITLVRRQTKRAARPTAAQVPPVVFQPPLPSN